MYCICIYLDLFTTGLVNYNSRGQRAKNYQVFTAKINTFTESKTKNQTNFQKCRS